MRFSQGALSQDRPHHQRRAAPRLEVLEDRTLPSGGLDPGFGTGGKQTVAFDLGGSNRDTATGVVLQPDGKLVLAGTADNRDFAVARLNPDGTPDPTFGPGGKRTIAFNLGGNN